MDQTAERFQEFRLFLDASAASNELLSAMDIRIELETKLLGEIEDIRDELGILRLVLEDQKGVAKDLEAILGRSRSPDVLKTHLARIERMEILTGRSIQSVRITDDSSDTAINGLQIRSLLKLKLQHASLSEAHSARRQAAYTSHQTHVATSYNKKVAEQLDMARRQAEETARQGNVILLFTVVTVVFVSFLA